MRDGDGALACGPIRRLTVTHLCLILPPIIGQCHGRYPSHISSVALVLILLPHPTPLTQTLSSLLIHPHSRYLSAYTFPHGTARPTYRTTYPSTPSRHNPNPPHPPPACRDTSPGLPRRSRPSCPRSMPRVRGTGKGGRRSTRSRCCMMRAGGTGMSGYQSAHPCFPC